MHILKKISKKFNMYSINWKATRMQANSTSKYYTH